jgi:hypothetical protein
VDPASGQSTSRQWHGHIRFARKERLDHWR